MVPDNSESMLLKYCTANLVLDLQSPQNIGAISRGVLWSELLYEHTVLKLTCRSKNIPGQVKRTLVKAQFILEKGSSYTGFLLAQLFWLRLYDFIYP